MKASGPNGTEVLMFGVSSGDVWFGDSEMESPKGTGFWNILWYPLLSRAP